MTRASPRFDELRESEQARMQELLHPALAPLFDVVFVPLRRPPRQGVFELRFRRDCAPWDLKGTS